jgi:hypothetical protein
VSKKESPQGAQYSLSMREEEEEEEEEEKTTPQCQRVMNTD